MKKLLLILTLTAFSLTAFAEGEAVTADTANENCDVAVVSNGGEADPASTGGSADASAAGSR